MAETLLNLLEGRIENLNTAEPIETPGTNFSAFAPSTNWSWTVSNPTTSDSGELGGRYNRPLGQNVLQASPHNVNIWRQFVSYSIIYLKAALLLLILAARAAAPRLQREAAHSNLREHEIKAFLDGIQTVSNRCSG